ncbi:MAG: DNA-formamidopyrimidine glycosylase [Chloroflexi bacterium]|nr:DNA-formamidopyrimidine glycosylase [Chloroflexota bacterium]
MPELPEVESIARRLTERLVGRCIASVEVRWAGAVDRPAVDAFVNKLSGQRVRAVQRRGKFVIIELDGRALLVHLRMAGRLLMCPATQPELLQDPYVRALFRLDDGSVLVFRDVRKFGRLYLVQDPAELVGQLGPEPLTDAFTPEALSACLRRKRQLKPLLLDQHVLAGLGNIYTDEALWAAQLHPLRSADSLSADEVARLHEAIRAVLRHAIDDGGTTLRDYRGCDGEPGEHQYALAVYGRRAQPCPRCGAAVERIVVGQRGTHLCPICQK